LNFAAVDIGSNAVRLLFCEVIPTDNFPNLRKISLIRLPIRLGEDVFSKGIITNQNTLKLSKSLLAFKQLVEVYEVVDYKIYATSAMREAKNNNKVLFDVKQFSDLDIEMIDGEKEAQLLFDTHIAEKIDQEKDYLYVDVGGGSTELTLISKGNQIGSKSFKIGTIRLKQGSVNESEWESMKDWITIMRKKYSPDLTIGTGGNINKLYKLIGLENYQLLGFDELSQMSNFLNKFSLEDRINKLGLKPDRADVITHASKIYLFAMENARTKKMFVPKVGLADGIIYELYNSYCTTN